MLTAHRLAGLRRWFRLACILFCFPLPALAQTAGDQPAPPAASSVAASKPWYQTIAFNGLVSASVVANFNSPPSRSNGFRIFDADDRTFKLDVAELVLQRAVSSPGDAGFRVDMTFGSSVSRITASSGLFRGEDGEAGDFDVHQALASYIIPAGRGLRVDAGKFVTHVGYEVIEGYDGFNDNHSRGLVFGYAEPITHTGVRVSYPFSDAVSAMLLVVNGWDNSIDNNSGKSIGAQVALTPVARVSFTANYIGGPEQGNNDSHLRHLVNLIAVGKVSSALTLTGSYDHGQETGVSLTETAGGGVRDVTWQGFAGYARLTVSPRLALVVRAEWFDDPQGARTGYVQSMNEITFTPEYRFHPSFVVRGDLRRDHSDHAVFELADGSHGFAQTTISLNGIYVF
jgi:hypothetical protein